VECSWCRLETEDVKIIIRRILLLNGEEIPNRMFSQEVTFPRMRKKTGLKIKELL